ncbi:hypothetical protein I7I49_13340 [Sinorhizobium meliloti]|jgi:hypothetical protein|nr:hypothetical protein [Sinorhizobium meliloti]
MKGDRPENNSYAMFLRRMFPRTCGAAVLGGKHEKPCASRLWAFIFSGTVCVAGRCLSVIGAASLAQLEAAPDHGDFAVIDTKEPERDAGGNPHKTFVPSWSTTSTKGSLT